MPNDPNAVTSAVGQQAAALMTGLPHGTVYPGPPGPPLQDVDAREHALRTLATFMSLLRFQRTGNEGGPPIPFRIKLDRINVYQPDDVDNHPAAPCIGILPGRVVHEPYGLGPPAVIEGTMDVYGVGTVLVRRSDHIETVGIEVVTAKHAELRGVLAGLKEALQAGDDSGALRLRCPNYFDRVACFRLDESEQIDDEAAALNRRRGHLFVLLQVEEVSLVRYRKMNVRAEVDVIGPTESLEADALA